jgi:uncharacterized membrane protein (UPF0127 family)
VGLRLSRRPFAGVLALPAPRFVFTLLLAAALPFAPPAVAPARADAPAASFMPLHEPLDRYVQSDVKIVSGTKVHSFRVWLADTPARREQGLMWIRSLPADRGMLFVFERPQPLSFWMKNTYVPLDLLFVAPDGRVIRIAENAKPQSLETIDSLGIALGVLELKGGTAKRLGLKTGDRLQHPAFAPGR